MKMPTHILSVFYFIAVIGVTFSGCAVSTLPSPYMAESVYQSSSLETLEEYNNLEFKVANNENYVYLTIIIKSDSLDRRYAKSILNLWLNSEGLHTKNSGFQFPLRKQTHPFLKNQFSSLTNWGGFRSALTDSQKFRLKSNITEAENKILYFNRENGRIEPVDSDGSRGFVLEKILFKNNIRLNFVIPLNAATKDQLGVIGSVTTKLAIGVEILPSYNILRSTARTQHPLNSPGIGRPLQQTGRSQSLQPRTVQKSEIYWLDLLLSQGES